MLFIGNTGTRYSTSTSKEDYAKTVSSLQPIYHVNNTRRVGTRHSIRRQENKSLRYTEDTIKITGSVQERRELLFRVKRDNLRWKSQCWYAFPQLTDILDDDFDFSFTDNSDEDKAKTIWNS